MNESLKRAQAAYDKKCKIYTLRVNLETEADIAQWLSKGKAATRIKALIRQDLKNNPVR